MNIKKVLSVFVLCLILIFPVFLVRASQVNVSELPKPDLSSSVALNDMPAGAKRISTGADWATFKYLYLKDNLVTGKKDLYKYDTSLAEGSRTKLIAQDVHDFDIRVTTYKILFSKYTDAITGYDIYAMNGDDTISPVVVKAGDQFNPSGIYQGSLQYGFFVYEDAVSSANHNIVYWSDPSFGVAASEAILDSASGIKTTPIPGGLSSTLKADIYYIDQAASNSLVHLTSNADGTNKVRTVLAQGVAAINSSQEWELSGDPNAPSFDIPYYLATRSGKTNVFAYNTRAAKEVQLTNAEGNVAEYSVGDKTMLLSDDSAFSYQRGRTEHVFFTDDLGSEKRIKMMSFSFTGGDDKELTLNETVTLASGSNDLSNPNLYIGKVSWLKQNGTVNKVYAIDYFKSFRLNPIASGNNIAWNELGLYGGNIHLYNTQTKVEKVLHIPNEDANTHYSGIDKVVFSGNALFFSVSKPGMPWTSSIYRYDILADSYSELVNASNRAFRVVSATNDLCVYMDQQISVPGFYLKTVNVSTKQVTAIDLGSTDVRWETIGLGKLVVYFNNTTSALYLRDVTKPNVGDSIKIADAPKTGMASYGFGYRPAMSSTKIAWADPRNVFVYDIATGKTTNLNVTTGTNLVKENISIDGDNVAWTEVPFIDFVSSGSIGFNLFSVSVAQAASQTGGLSVFNLGSNSIVYSTSGSVFSPYVSGNNVFYAQQTTNGTSLFMATLASSNNVLSALPATGIFSAVYLFSVSALGYLLIKHRKIFRKKKVWER